MGVCVGGGGRGEFKDDLCFFISDEPSVSDCL